MNVEALERERNVALDRITALEAEVARLTAERDEAQLSLATYKSAPSGTQHVRDDYKARVEAAEKERDDRAHQISELVRTARSEQVRAEAAEKERDDTERARRAERAGRKTAEAEVARLREALQGLLNDDDLPYPPDGDSCFCSMCQRIREARAALAPEQEQP